MAKRAQGLTARGVATMKTPGVFADGGGLYLNVSESGGKSWLYRYQIAGRRRAMGLGSLAVLSLAEAREKAAALRKEVAAGIDPLAEKTAPVAAPEPAKAAPTFREVAEEFIGRMRPSWRSSRHAAQWESTLQTYVYPTIGSRPTMDVDTEAVLRCLTPIWTEKPETASRVRGRIETILDSAKARGLRSGENPAEWKGHLALILPAKTKIARVKHHESLPYAAMPEFWPRLQITEGLGARALELAVLTACRTSEVLGARWEEIDTEAAVWTIPADRMKAGVEHRVPLSGPALALVRKLASIRRGELVVPGNRADRPLSNMTMAMALRRMKVDATPHGMRSTFRTWAAEQTSTPHEVCEAALAHTVGSKVVQAYQRGDLFEKRRALMTAWAAFVEGRPAGVVPIRGAA